MTDPTETPLNSQTQTTDLLVLTQVYNTNRQNLVQYTSIVYK